MEIKVHKINCIFRALSNRIITLIKFVIGSSHGTTGTRLMLVIFYFQSSVLYN